MGSELSTIVESCSLVADQMPAVHEPKEELKRLKGSSPCDTGQRSRSEASIALLGTWAPCCALSANLTS